VNEEVDVTALAWSLIKQKQKKEAAQQPCYRHYLESTDLTVLSLWSMTQAKNSHLPVSRNQSLPYDYV